jgi:DNA-binding GntR family transcriptional regulator
MSVVVRPLPDQVFDWLRERIVGGSMMADERLNQDAIARELGVSKIPVREALTRLTQEGLVSLQPNRGWFVQALSAREAEEIFALRLSIEPATAAEACRTDDARARRNVSEAASALAAARGGTLTEYATRHRDFHLAMVAQACRPLTTQWIARLAVLSERYVIRHLRTEGRDARAQSEHDALATAWLAGDAAAVEQRLHGHILVTLSDLRSQFTD